MGNGSLTPALPQPPQASPLTLPSALSSLLSALVTGLPLEDLTHFITPEHDYPIDLQLALLCISDAAASLVEQRPRWVLVPRGQSGTLHCILKNSQYPWMSWYQQDLQGQLQSLASLRSPGDEEAISHPGADYLATRVSDTELKLHVANVTQGRTLYCTCSKDTMRNLP